MAQVREGIDTLDREIVALLGRRMRYIEAAARIKDDRDKVLDEWRVEDVASKVRAEAVKVDFPPQLADRVYRTLMTGSIEHEFERFDALRTEKK